jgi:succinoglycan biosynthesis protein ExoH
MAVSKDTSDKIRVIGLWLTLAVVLHHAHNLQFAAAAPQEWLRYAEEFFHYGLRALAVPFFFVCSGWFLCDRADFLRAWPREVGKRSRSLLLPFLLWSGAWIVAMWALQRLPMLEEGFGRERISLADPWQVLDLMTLDPIPHPLWYMRDLFLLALASPAIVWLLRRRWGMVAWFAGSLALYYSVPSILVREVGDCLFFGAGVALALHKPRIPATPLGAELLLAFGCLGLIGYHCWWEDTRQEESQWIVNTAALLGLPALWLLYDRAPRWLRGPAMLAAADYALFIYMGHEPMVTLTRKLILHLTGETTAGLACAWLGAAFGVMGGLVVVAWVLRTHAPWLYGLLTGGRVGPARPAPASVPPAAVPAPAIA